MARGAFRLANPHLAFETCQRYQAEKRHLDQRFRDYQVQQFLAINQVLADGSSECSIKTF
ncbi:hypothetical protein [Allopseudospirillum japonicum]|uniref:hypothetical protein n=1 Tax=Allopseudospirillum japonicum TaxID=64971 RepID=UPI000B823667|nr:hypothetical protein [Allopseudospirillum japonicum]